MLLVTGWDYNYRESTPKKINIEDKTATEQLKPTKELDENDKKNKVKLCFFPHRP